MPHVLVSQELQEEHRHLMVDACIRQIALELITIGQTAEQVKADAKFRVLNERYLALNGRNDTRTIGSIHRAVVAKMEQLSEILNV